MCIGLQSLSPVLRALHWSMKARECCKCLIRHIREPYHQSQHSVSWCCDSAGVCLFYAALWSVWTMELWRAKRGWGERWGGDVLERARRGNMALEELHFSKSMHFALTCILSAPARQQEQKGVAPLKGCLLTWGKGMNVPFPQVNSR